jgi:hypothetical protein
VGQTAVGSGSSTYQGLSHGFWQEFGVAGGSWDYDLGNCDGLPGTNFLDIIYMIAYLYKGGPAPKPYTVCSADPDASCDVNMLDILFLIAYLYKGGPATYTCEEWASSCGGRFVSY